MPLPRIFVACTLAATVLTAFGTAVGAGSESPVDVTSYQPVQSWPLENAVQAFDVAPSGDFALLTYKGAATTEARLSFQRFDVQDGVGQTIRLERGKDGVMIQPVSEATAIAIADDGATFLANWPAYLVAVNSDDGVMQVATSIRDAGQGMTAFNSLEYASDGTAAVGVGDEVVRFDLSGEGLAYHRDFDASGGQSLAVIDPMRVAIGTTEAATVVTAGSDEPDCTMDGTIKGLDIHPDGSRLAAAVYDQEASRTDIVVWSMADCGELARWPTGVSFVPDMAWLPDGNTIATAGGDGQLRFWDVATETQVHGISVEEETGFKMKFSKDGTTLITFTLWGDRTLRAYRTR